jgi:structure-specific recognition protein 1
MTSDSNSAVAEKASLKGWTWGKVDLGETLSIVDAEGNQVAQVVPGDVSQATIQGKSDLALEFIQEAADKEDECLTEIRFFIPNEDLLNRLKDDISKRASSGVGGEKVCSLENVPLVLPRGHFDLDFYTTSIKMRGKSFDYAIKYSNINRAFVLMKPDGVHVAFVIGLDKPVRQGNTAYNFLCAQFDMNRVEDALAIRLPEESMFEESQLEKDESGKPLADILQRLLKFFAKVNVQFACLDFKATNGKNCVRCSHRATEGHLYCLKKAFIFITKPVVYIRYEDVVAVEFSRAETWMTSTRFFDLKVYKKGENQPYDFQQIDRNEYQPLIEFLQSAGIRIRNLEKESGKAAVATEGEATLLGEDFEDDEEDSEFEDEGSSDDEDEDDESDEDEDASEESEDEDRKKKKSKKHKSDKGDEEDEEPRKEKKSKKHKKEKKHKKDKKRKRDRDED